jgi:diaminopimelate decarboxylase
MTSPEARPAHGRPDEPRRGRPPGRDGAWRAGRLAGIEPAALAERFGTPVYVYDLDVVTRALADLRRALPERFDIAYAVKANPALTVIGHLARLGTGADVSSAGELAAAVRAGVPGDRIVATGPGKADDFLRSAVRAGLRAVTVESRGELDRLERIAAEEGRRVPILLRLASTDPMSRASGPDARFLKFGMASGDAALAAARAAGSPWLHLRGVHCFGATNVLDAASLAEHVAATVSAAREVTAAAGVGLELVDVGGGLGVPYEPHESALDLTDYGRRLRTLDAAWTAEPAFASMRVVVEPGRFLVGPAGAYLSRVTDVKMLGGRVVAILDGGIHQFLRPALVGQEHRLRLAGSARPDERQNGAAGRPVPVAITGPLCTGLDVFSARAVMPPPRVGDLVAALDAGAYGFTQSMPGFQSHGWPAEVAVKDGEARLIRPRVGPDELLGTQIVPAW